ncbi:hypothetical protein GCM10017786_44650 [Amycolatopsis deserti]|uniref:Uncharacterized protein n=1 Tax=Amycolatopsis deserti TaxID=185696 RepID=A0ABQ3J5T1_9PSEU|nr:hypothetical protein [Amycolatopsis deserti]GHF06159.1 hypothetical protein GCM10017786_44650 [Amycolatopsis deserti]
MGNHLETFAKIIGKLKTPLTLAGLTVVILYLLYQQVLNLSVLSPLQGNETFTLVDSIVSKVFWLAVVAVVFGFAGFVLTALLQRRTRPKRAAVSLVGTSLDPELSSPAGANPPAGNRYEVLEQKFEVGAIDCKFVNRGDATAFLDSFSVLVKGVTVDRSPVLSYSYRVQGRSVVVSAHNAGWGAASRMRLRLVDPVLPDLFPARSEVTVPVVEPGATVPVLRLDPDPAVAGAIGDLRRRRAEFLGSVAEAMRREDDSIRASADFRTLLSHHERWHVSEYFADLPRGDSPRQQWHLRYVGALPGTAEVPVGITVTGSYETENGDSHEITRTDVRCVRDDPASPGVLWLGDHGFSYEFHEVDYMVVPPSTVHAVVLDAEPGQRRDYALSRAIEPGGVERFHIALASVKSATYEITLGFRVDGREHIWSKPMSVQLERLHGSALPDNLTDGASFELQDGRLVLGGSRTSPWW